MTDGSWFHVETNQPITLESLAEELDRELAENRIEVTLEQRTAIVEHQDYYECCALHSVSQVLNVRCLCADCRMRESRP